MPISKKTVTTLGQQKNLFSFFKAKPQTPKSKTKTESDAEPIQEDDTGLKVVAGTPSTVGTASLSDESSDEEWRDSPQEEEKVIDRSITKYKNKINTTRPLSKRQQVPSSIENKKRKVILEDTDEESECDNDVDTEDNADELEHDGAVDEEDSEDLEVDIQDDTDMADEPSIKKKYFTVQPVQPQHNQTEKNPTNKPCADEDQEPPAKKAKPLKEPAMKKPAGWGFLDGRGKALPKKKVKESPGKTSAGPKVSKQAYIGGDGLAIISHPQEMFDDMVTKQLCSDGKDADIIKPLLKKLLNRPLKVATMCSGTESPVLALDMIAKAIEEFFHTHMKKDSDEKELGMLQIEHVFSCEIEPFKQAYIERNFQPPLLFRDIRELGKRQAHTAYGSLVDVPNTPGCVDMLIAGTSCVDYSNLNNEKKAIEGSGESGQTFRGMMDWIKKSQPPLVILENVYGAPWQKKCDMFSEIGYDATFSHLDTKTFYIPHTRQRGYLLAVRRNSGASGSLEKKRRRNEKTLLEWKDYLRSKLQRPASAALDAFMLPNDDPRVLRGRARLSSGNTDSSENRVDWTRCESRHQFCRANEELGDKRPLTGWSDSGNCSMPSFAWNEWVNAQVHRIHDLIDINTLRQAKMGIDATRKTSVWNLSQNVDRDTMGKLGLCQCLTPTGVPYVTNRGGPLVGEELLLLQGIPADDLLLTKESEEQLKDLAGNAMSTTVVGACMLSALVLFYESLSIGAESAEPATDIVASLVPRSLSPATEEITITRDFGTYDTNQLNLGPMKSTSVDIANFFEQADSSARKCTSESGNKKLPKNDILTCSECQYTSSVALATPPRKFEEHVYSQPSDAGKDRTDPGVFRRKLLSLLPMRIELEGFDAKFFTMPAGIDEKLWLGWTDALNSATTTSSSPAEFRFAQLTRSHNWTVTYKTSNGSKLELQLSKMDAVWFLFGTPPVSERGSLRESLERPLARMSVNQESNSKFSILKGKWEVCYPVTTPVQLKIQGDGQQQDSWFANLGLKGTYEEQIQFEKLKINVITTGLEDLASSIDGVYKLLPRCGGACGSLHKRIQNIEGEKTTERESCFFFLEAGRCTVADDDALIFSTSMHRTSYGEYRDTLLQVEPSFRPIFGKQALKTDQDLIVSATIPGQWKYLEAAGIKLIANSTLISSLGVTSGVTSPCTNLIVPMVFDGWKSCPEVLCCDVPLHAADKLYQQCNRHTIEGVPVTMEVNLQKSNFLFKDLAFVSSRLSIPDKVSKNWRSLDSTPDQRLHLDPCEKSFPISPGVKWTVITKSGRLQYVPIEDGREASIYEQALKKRPDLWKVHLKALSTKDESGNGRVQLQIGCNAFSLVHRALGLLPDSLARKALLELPGKVHRECTYEWRIVPYVDKDADVEKFSKLFLTSNKLDKGAEQPPNFTKYKLRREQLRSLSWMLSQESSKVPFMEEEVTESFLPNLNWLAEGRVKRPALVRGGIVADEVGYGKTAITLGLIDAAQTVNGDSPKPPKEFLDGFMHTKATLVIVPAHLMSQWPKEIEKFLGKHVNKVVVKDMASFNKLTVADIQNADIVIVNFTVLGSEKYFSRLARISGINASSLPKGGKTGGRHFDTVYNECLTGLSKRVSSMKKDSSSVFEEIEEDAHAHSRKELEVKATAVRLDGKKAIYKNVSEDQTKVETTMSGSGRESPKAGAKDKLFKADKDPWGLSTSQVKNSLDNMKCPPLEMFFWNRLVVDEFHYLADKKDRARVLTLVIGLKATFRWCLSGTPPHQNFDDVQSLSNLLGIHLGVNEVLPGQKLTKRGRNSDEQSGLERLREYLEMRTPTWHERRHSQVAQEFLNRFVRQNIAEIDEIKCEEHVVSVELPPAEKALYMELETYLKSLEMNNKKALKSKKSSTGDREMRMMKVLEDSDSAQEALLKRCAHFNMSKNGENQTALQTCGFIIGLRKKQLVECEEQLVDIICRAIRQRNRVVDIQPNWEGMVRITEKGEVQDRFGVFLLDVENKQSVPGGADGEVHKKIVSILADAQRQVSDLPRKYDAHFAHVNGDSEADFDKADCKRKRPKKINDKSQDEECLYQMKYALREHMHTVRNTLKELCGRIRSFRYFEFVRDFQLKETEIKCLGSDCCSHGGTHKTVLKEQSGVLSSCGHVGCINSLRHCADKERCIDPSCSAQVKHAHIVPATALGRDGKEQSALYGAKLTQLVKNVKQLVSDGDRVIVFVQFKDLKQKVAEALEEYGVKAMQVKGTVQKQVQALDVLQKEKPDKNDPRVLLLTMDDESSAGANLTTCNHAVFVHPLLADTQQQYDAYETQAIGRIRRYGQNKTVNIWRYLARDTIDETIYDERSGKN